MTENYVCNQLIAGGHSCYYWTGDHSCEVDFLVQLDGAIIPIEVKSAEHTQSKSLNAFQKSNQPPYTIKLSGKIPAWGWTEIGAAICSVLPLNIFVEQPED